MLFGVVTGYVEMQVKGTTSYQVILDLRLNASTPLPQTYTAETIRLIDRLGKGL